MQDVISTIRTMCQRFPCQPKYLILLAFRMKGQVMKYINDSGINAVNLHVISAGSLAMEWAQADVLERGAKILSYNDVADLVGEILASLKASGKLEFFGDSLITPGLNRVISGCILDLTGIAVSCYRCKKGG